MGHVLVRCRPSVMFSRTVLFVSPACTGQVRGMATLRDIQNRLKAVKNIQKITKSMKIVSAAKFNKAERELKCARPYGHGAKAFFDSAEVTQDESKPTLGRCLLIRQRSLRCYPFQHHEGHPCSRTREARRH